MHDHPKLPNHPFPLATISLFYKSVNPQILIFHQKVKCVYSQKEKILIKSIFLKVPYRKPPSESLNMLVQIKIIGLHSRPTQLNSRGWGCSNFNILSMNVP